MHKGSEAAGVGAVRAGGRVVEAVRAWDRAAPVFVLPAEPRLPTSEESRASNRRAPAAARPWFGVEDTRH